MGRTWDPTPGSFKTLRAGWVFGPGVATYVLDDQQVIHLTMTMRDGEVRRYDGPIPARFQAGTPEAHRAAKFRRMVFGALALYPIGAVVGFLVGYSVSGRQAWTGIIGAFVGIVAVILTAHFAVLLLGATQARKSSNYRESG